MCKPGEMGFCVFACLTYYGKMQALADGFCDIAERDAFFCHGVVYFLPGLLFCDQAIQYCGVVSVNGGPTIVTVSDIDGFSILLCYVDDDRHETVVVLAVDGGRQSHYIYFSAFGGGGGCCFL